MKSKYVRLLIVLQILTTIILVNSCSSVPKSDYQNFYYSPDYEDESFKNVSMVICYPILDFNLPYEVDSAQVQNLKEFDENFRKYFPDGIKAFSSVTQTGWIFYDMMKYFGEIIEYQAKTEDSLDFYISLPDSLSYFQSQSNADFMFILNFSAVTLNPPDSSNPESKYSTTLDHEYSIWDRRTGNLVAVDKVIAKIEFDRLSGKWPYRGAIMKTAALIFEKLPMFEK